VFALASVVPIVVTTHLPRLSLLAYLPLSTVFFVLVTGRFGPAMALVSGSAEPRVRGSFMSLNASIQQLGAGVAALVAGSLVGKAADGTLSGVGNVGWLAAAFTVVSVALAYRIRVVDDRGAGAPPE